LIGWADGIGVQKQGSMYPSYHKRLRFPKIS
jgi:hypothetical protein